MSALQQKKLLRQRIYDIACGALGGEFTDDEFADADFLSRFIPALRLAFGCQDREFFWYPSNLHHFDNVDSTTDFLFCHGVRANFKPSNKGKS